MEVSVSRKSTRRELPLDAVARCNAVEAWISLGNLVEAFGELEHVAARLRSHPRVLSLRCRIYAGAKLWNALFDCSDTLTRRAPRMAEAWVWKAWAASRMMDGSLGKARAILLSVARRFQHDPRIAFELACYSAQLAFPLESSAWIAVVLAIAAKRGTLGEWQAKVQRSENLKSIVVRPPREGVSPTAPAKRKKFFPAVASRCLLLYLWFASIASNAAVQIDATAKALRAAAEAGGEIIITNGGVITLSRPVVIQSHTTIAGAGVTLSGGEMSRIFEIAPVASLELIDLTLIDGRAASGGAIYNDGGSFTARNCTFGHHAAVGQAAAEPGGTGYNASGGAIFSSGRVLLADCRFEKNRVEGGAGDDGSPAQPGGNGGHCSGGAVSSVGSLLISNCVFVSNESSGGRGGAGAVDLSSATPMQISRGGSAGAGIGGALNASGTCIVRSTMFSNNVALGGTGGPGGGAGGPAGGGAIAVEGAVLLLSLVVFVDNEAAGAPGAASAPSSDPAVPERGSGGTGGEATGSAVYVNGGQSVIERCTALRNVVLGGNGSAGADSPDAPPVAQGVFGGTGGAGGGVNGTFCNIGQMLLTTTTFAENVLRGGNGGAGGRGVTGGPGGKGGHSYGGGLCNMGTATIINCTMASNACWGGTGGAGGEAASASPLQASRPGDGGPGGHAGAGAVWTDMEHDEVSIVFCTLAGNEATVGAGGTAGMTDALDDAANGGQPGTFRGNNLGSMGMTHVQNTICASTASGPQAVGMIMDLGGNLCSDGTCQFTNRSSLNDTEPGLLPLTNNGGPTLTMALQRGSRAINRAERGSDLACDQRGFVRLPQTRHDVGAFETAARPGFTVSGFVSDGSNGIAGLTMKMGAVTAVTDATGYYELHGVGRGRRVIKPIASGLSFSPRSRQIVVRRDVTVPPFSAKPLE